MYPDCTVNCDNRWESWENGRKSQRPPPCGHMGQQRWSEIRGREKNKGALLSDLKSALCSKDCWLGHNLKETFQVALVPLTRRVTTNKDKIILTDHMLWETFSIPIGVICVASAYLFHHTAPACPVANLSSSYCLYGVSHILPMFL